MQAETTPEAFDALYHALATLSPDRLSEINDELGKAIRALSTPEHLAQKVKDPSEVGVEGAEDLPLVGTAALGAACAVIIEGREAFARVVENPSELAGVRPIAAAAELVEVVMRANEEVTGAAAIGVQPWLSGCFIDLFGVAWMSPAPYPQRYFDRFHQRSDELCHDDVWVAWWSGSGYDRMLLYLEYNDYLEESEGVDFKLKTRKLKKDAATLRVDVFLSPGSVGADREGEAVNRADGDLHRVMTTVGVRLKLGAVPAMP